MTQKSLLFLVSFILFFFSNYLPAQDKLIISVKGSTFELALDNRDYRFADIQKNHFTIRDYYDFTDVSKSGMYKLPSRELIVAIPPEQKAKVTLLSKKENKYQNVIPVLNPKVELIDDSTYNLKEVDYPERIVDEAIGDILEVKGYLWLREFNCIHIKLHTHIYDEKNNVLTEFTDIKLKLDFDKETKILDYSPLQIKSEFDENLKLVLANADIAEQFRSSPKILAADTTGNWINYSANYVKLGTSTDGLFRITKANLDNLGVNTSAINPQTFQLFESGAEKPIYVFGENDLSFDPGDYIEFFGTKNYSKISPRVINPNNQPYNNYLDKYTDTTIYFLTWGSTSGLRAQINNTFQPTVTDTIKYYTNFIHLEEHQMDALMYTFHNDLVESQFPFWDTGKGWYWMWLATWATPRSFTISASDVVADKTAKFFGKVVSRGSSGSTNVHLTKLLINSSVIDSQVTSRYQRVLLQGSISSNSIVNGNNSLQITYSEANGASSGQMVVDWVEAEYPRLLKRIDNSLYFEYRDISSTSFRMFKIENVTTSDYLLFKIKPSFKRITGFVLSGGNLYFTDTVSNNDAYFLVRQDIALTPKFFSSKTFANLRNQNSQVDYIGIAHPAFWTSVNSYVNLISSNYSVTTNLFSVEDIFDEFGFGYPTSDAIRDFIIYKYQFAPSPKPSYLVFFGDANYDYKKYRTALQGIVGGGNYIPSYGFPISDPFYAVWDSTGARLPQMYVGRIPLNKSSEMDFYKSKVQNNLTIGYDEWNKKYLFFSGGRADYPSEIALYKSVNDSVINNYVKVPPLAGNYVHFYKTTNPLSDFGPYTYQFVNHAIEAGAVFISYIGHSGTATWDNSISSVKQLKNKVNRNPVISDFGCSTNKFAEPDLVAFGERFILDPDGQALGYLGNSALGFVSTAIKAPGDFYKHVIVDTIYQIGKAHISAKYLMFQQLGSSNVVNEFSFSNTLMGDPIIKMKIPPKPNLTITSTDVIFDNEFMNDTADSVSFKLVLNNYGTVVSQTFKATVDHFYQSALVEHLENTLNLPYFKDTLTFWVNIKNKPGQHSLVINLDTENSIAEIYENDNSTSVQFNVASALIRDLFVNRFDNPKLDSLIILNPTAEGEKQMSVFFQTADDIQFTNPQQFTVSLDTFSTKVIIQTPPVVNRKWLRYKWESDIEWSAPLSYSNLSGYKFFVGDAYSLERQSLNNLRVVNNEIQLSRDTITISIISAGSYSGQYCIITKNGINLLSNTFFQGIGIIVFNDKTLAVETSTYFELFNNPSGVTACTNFINSIPTGKLVALGVSGDAYNNVTAALKSAVNSLGGTRFSSIQFKAPYALIGKKGADSTQVKQILKNPYEGPIQLDSSIVVSLDSGSLISTLAGPSSEWKNLKVAQTNQNNSEIKFRILGIKSDGTVDTLPYLTLVNNEANLTSVSANTYPYIKVYSAFNSDSLLNSPSLSKIEVNYKGIAELGTNFQTVKLNKDTVMQGEKSKLNFYVYNAGETSANDFKVQVEVLRADNSSELVLDQQINSIAPGERQLLAAGFVTEFEAGQYTYKIMIDPDNQIIEYYKDNNVFLKPFFVKRDTTRPVLEVLFDGKEIMDGDYVSNNPKIRIELSDASLSSVYNSSSLSLKMDNSQIALEKNASQVSYEINSENPKIVVEFSPTLEEGEHALNIFLNDRMGSMLDTSALQKRFVVSNEMKILDIYNYPNPMNESTYFTFNLTQVPEQIKIMIYTIGGKLVKEIVKKDGLSTNFNKIYWDTRDEDGDLLSNGTYLYKVIMTGNGKTETSTHKLAIVR